MSKNCFTIPDPYLRFTLHIACHVWLVERLDNDSDKELFIQIKNHTQKRFELMVPGHSETSVAVV